MQYLAKSWSLKKSWTLKIFSSTEYVSPSLLLSKCAFVRSEDVIKIQNHLPLKLFVSFPGFEVSLQIHSCGREWPDVHLSFVAGTMRPHCSRGS